MNIPTTLDDDLCECPDPACDLSAAIADSERELAHLRGRVEDEATELNTTRLARQLQRHGRYLRLAGEFDEALEAKDEAVEIWQRYGRTRAHFLCRLQRAVIRFEAGRFEQALAEARALRSEIGEKTDVYRDMVHEVLGKCHYGLGEPVEATEHFEVALEVRKQRGNDRHIRRTRRMLERVESRKP